ncbi:hypothetical protein [Segeticoccus rhizosphaerae]|uniref:hypothetical protein n=1 Tax=Segeticoccus rhizosphaerae TaxID=1104777 RepID=UPI0010C152A8|nr:hypothetical protein [Ornithinicoccus soli]
MDSQAHVRKARRLEATLYRLELTADSETIIETCMLAGTHYLNALAHDNGILDVSDDLLHSDKPELGMPIPDGLAPAFASMKFIEDLRPGLVRGPDDPSEDDVQKCLDNFGVVASMMSGQPEKSS